MQTITKNAKTIRPGEVFITEYGDYGNWVKFVFVSCEPYGENCTKINVRYITNNSIFSVFEFTPIDKIKFDVLKEDFCENTDNNY